MWIMNGSNSVEQVIMSTFTQANAVVTHHIEDLHYSMCHLSDRSELQLLSTSSHYCKNRWQWNSHTGHLE